MKHIALWTRVLCTATAYNLAGCTGVVADEPLRSASYRLVEHETVTLNRGLSVRYDRFEDSRCPPGAMCIWAGKVSYHFTVTGKAGTESFALDYEGDKHASTTLPGIAFGISFAGVRARPIEQHAVVLELIAD